MAYHGEQYLWDNFKKCIEDVFLNEGEDVAVDYMEEALADVEFEDNNINK